MALPKVIQPPADQRKAALGEIDDRRSEIEPAEKPRLDRVLIGGLDVEEMVRHQRANMAVDDEVGDVAAARLRRSQQGQAAADRDDDHRCSRPRQDAMPRAGSRRPIEDALPQAIRRRVVRRAPHHPAQRVALGNAAVTGGAPAQMIAHGGGEFRVELAIHVCVEVAFGLFAGHRSVSIAAVSFSRVASRSRARASRDITVPIGTRTTAAISL